MTRHGGKILVDQLQLHGVRRVFSVPGESFLAVLDGLIDSEIENIVCRHEGGAAMMAEATGKLTGTPGIAFVTRGPGASNASTGIHIAAQDSTPMILFVGQISRGHKDREAFQEVDYKSFFGSVAKWVAEIDDPARLPEYINRAFHTATSGRPGPVVLSLPEDMLSAASDIASRPPTAVSSAGVSRDQISEIVKRLDGAQRPLIVAGGSIWSIAAAKQLETLAQHLDVPVVTTFRRQDHIDNRSKYFAGDLGVGMNPTLANRLKNADLLLILGARFGDIATAGYTLVDPNNPAKQIIHVFPDPQEHGRVYRADLAITARADDIVSGLLAAKPKQKATPSNWTSSARADYEAWQVPQKTPGDVRMEAIVKWLSDTMSIDTIMTNGAGNYAAWLHRYFCFKSYGTQIAPTSGSMGYGFPAAIAAKIENPDKTVICFAGDGCFQMTLNELSTAKQYGVNVIVIVANNGRYGTIRMHQEKTYPGRVSGTDLANPDFVALARAYGGHGEYVEKTEDFAPAFERARASQLPSVIELRIDPEALATGMTLTQARNLGKKS